MKIGPRRRVILETVPVDRDTSFAFREFKWPCYKFNWHYHPELELTLIVRGRGLRFVGDSVQEYREGDLVFLGAGTPHSWSSKPIPGQTVNALVIQFLPDFMGERFLNLPETLPLREFFSRARRGLLIAGKTRAAITEQMLRMRRERTGSLQHICTLLSMLNTLAESSDCTPLAVSAFAPVLNKQASKTVNAVCGLIHAQLDAIPSQAEAARLARLSPAAFSRFFKRCVGRTYVAYANELRIGMACRALMETDKSITAIAYEAGFNNLSNFNRRFLQLKNMTPRQYRALTQVE